MVKNTWILHLFHIENPSETDTFEGAMLWYSERSGCVQRLHVTSQPWSVSPGCAASHCNSPLKYLGKQWNVVQMLPDNHRGDVHGAPSSGGDRSLSLQPSGM